MPASATNSPQTKLSVMTANVSSTVINRPPSSGPMFSTATCGLKSSNTVFQVMTKASVDAPAIAASEMQREHHEIAIGQAVLLQDGTDLAARPDFAQRRRIGGPQRAIFLADAETRHAVATAADDVRRNRDGPQRLKVVVRILAGELQIDDVVFQHRVETALVQALQLVDFLLEGRGLDADAPQIEIGRAAGDGADLLALEVLILRDLHRITLRHDHDR